MKYNIKINEVDYSDHLQIPIQLSFTLDESLDVGSVVLENMDTNVVFKPYSLVEIEIVDEYQSNIYHMFVESDIVEEVFTINGSKYKHQLVLIELTKYLETITMSDFSVTDNTVFESLATNQITWSGSLSSFTVSTSGSSFLCYISFYSAPTRTYQSQVNSSFKLPFISYRGKYQPWFNSAKYDYMDFDIKITKPNGNIIEISNGNGGSFVPDTNGVYKATYTPIPTTLNFSYNFYADPTPYNEKMEFTFEIVDSISEVHQEIGYVLDKVLALNEPTAYNFTKIAVKPGSYKTAFEYAPDIYNKIDYSTRCPEVDFTGNKTLKEVLSTLGKEVNGIPRLKYNTVTKRLYIDFDIIDEDVVVDEYELDFDINTKTKGANMTSYFNAMVTNIESVISDEVSSYPGKSGSTPLFITPRSINPDSGVMTIENCGIVLPENIERITKLLCITDFSDQSTYYDITSFIYEETLFNSLIVTKEEEGQQAALYFSKGSNTINNIGTIPESNNLLGWSSTTYVINTILKLSNVDISPTNDPRQYGFYVEYIPRKKINVITEQENQYSFDRYIATPFNNDVNIVSSTLMGREIQRQLKATSSNTLSINIDFNLLYQLPELGDKIMVDGETYYVNTIALNLAYNTTVSIEFSKDWNKISDRIGVNQQYREYAIPNESIVRRTLNMEKVIFATTQETLEGEWEYDTELQRDYNEYLNGTVSSDSYTSGIMLMHYYPDALSSNASAGNQRILASNTIRHSNSFINYGSTKDNYSVGQSIIQSANFSILNPATWADLNINQDVDFVDDVGFFDSCEFIERVGSKIIKTFSLSNATIYPNTSTVLNAGYDYYSELKVNKDAKEALTFNITRSLVSKNENINIGFGSFNRFWADISNGTLELVTIAGNINSNNVVTSYTKVGNVTVTTDGDKIKLTLPSASTSLLDNTKTFAIKGNNSEYVLMKVSREFGQDDNGTYTFPTIYLHPIKNYETSKYQNHDRS